MSERDWQLTRIQEGALSPLRNPAGNPPQVRFVPVAQDAQPTPPAPAPARPQPSGENRG